MGGSLVLTRLCPGLVTLALMVGTSGCFLDRSGTAVGPMCESVLECPDGEDCVDGICVDIDAGGDRDAGVDGGVDAGLDADLPDDAGHDGGTDAGFDAGPPLPDGGAFDPSALGTVALWLRGETLPLGPVATWNDESGADNHAELVGSGQVQGRVLFGRRIASFDGSANLRTQGVFRHGNPVEIFVVARFRGSSQQRLLHSRQGDHYMLALLGGDIRLTVSSVSVSGTLSEGFHRFRISPDATGTSLAVDGAEVLTVPEPIPSRDRQLGIGGNPGGGGDALVGEIAEIIVFTEALAPLDRAVVEAYLVNEWAAIL